MAEILQHPSAPVTFDPPRVSSYTPPTEEEWARLAAVEGLRHLCERYGYPRVLRWVRNLAAIHGQEL